MSNLEIKPSESSEPPRCRRFALGLVLAAGLVSCTSSGTATGQLVTAAGKREPVTFVWRSDGGDWRHGTVSVVLPSGDTYRGKYHQVTESMPLRSYGPMWVGFRPYWPDWPAPWYAGRSYAPGSEGWLTVYEGKVVARLSTPHDPSHYMRCRFSLDDPSLGMTGGGNGDCQLSDGSAVRDAVLAAG
jgi:hypothetical protein